VRGRAASLAALALFACASAYTVQGVGFNQNAHYALVRSLADGTPTIDRYRETTLDVAYYRGHYYAAKAPGLAFVDLPLYVALRGVGIAHAAASNAPTRTDIATVWLIGLWSALLPALVLLVLVTRVAEELAPGFGVAAAATLAGATLLLPFSELLFAHSLSALFGFASFALIWKRRAPGLAGLLGGLAICVEYPLALAAILLCAYAARQGARRAVEYAAGAAVGLVPLALYDWWAFGSPTHLSYRDALSVTGSGVANRAGLFGVGAPSAHVLGELLFSSIGLLVITPVVALSVLGLFLLWRDGRRLEAALVAALAVAFLVYNAGYETPFGGASPGPRFVVPMLPFLELALAPAWRARPLVSTSLALASALSIALLTSTGALDASDGLWTRRFLGGRFVATLLSYAGLPRAVAIVPWFVLLAAGGWVVLRIIGFPVARSRDLLLAVGSLGLWLPVALLAPRLFTSPQLGEQPPALTPLVLGARARRDRRSRDGRSR
jgi:hypothetical protein